MIVFIILVIELKELIILVRDIESTRIEGILFREHSDHLIHMISEICFNSERMNLREMMLTLKELESGDGVLIIILLMIKIKVKQVIVNFLVISDHLHFQYLGYCMIHNSPITKCVVYSK